jgi:hypothetical protein
MRGAIIEKLKNTLGATLNREADVVYGLVLIRKILEGDRSMPHLIFFCDWAPTGAG